MNVSMLVLAIICTILAILMFMRKGSFLVAGYNTMSEKERMKVDKIKMTNAIGIIMSVFAITMFLGAFDTRYMAYLLLPALALTLAIIFFGQRYMLNEDGRKEYDQKDHRLNKVIALIAYILILFFIYSVMYTGEVSYTLDDDLTFRSSYYRDESVDISKINSIIVTDDHDIGIKKNGFDNLRIRSGRFSNEELGDYFLYAYDDAESYIIIDDGTTYVYGSDNDEIKKLYTALEELYK